MSVILDFSKVGTHVEPGEAEEAGSRAETDRVVPGRDSDQDWLDRKRSRGILIFSFDSSYWCQMENFASGDPLGWNVGMTGSSPS